MMDEARERIAMSLCAGMLLSKDATNGKGSLWEDAGYLFITEEYRYRLADQILSIVKELGYRRIHDLKPLSPEETIIAACGDCPFEGRFNDEDCHACQRQLEGVSQATLASIQKQIEEGNR